MSLKLSIIIPAFKERQKIERDIEAAHTFLEGHGIGGEIIVVDDGSPDDTAQIARALQAKYSELRVVSYENNRGKGHAVAQGVAQAGGEFIMFADAGLCVPYDIATIGMTILEMGMCDIAHGSRRMRGSILRPQPLYRRVGSRVYAVVIHTLFGVPWHISDTQCGFKLYRGEVARELYSEVVTDGFMFDIEVILRALRRKKRILEFPVLWSNDADTRYDPIWGTVRNFKELIRIRWALATEARDRAVLLKERSGQREDATVT
ncbi:MAG: glycosyltransferase [Candidatus Baltobacteraceae bacterium]